MNAHGRLGRTGRLLLAAGLALSALVVSVGGGVARAEDSSTTVTGPNPAWDEIHGAPMAALPTATVSQTTDLVDQTVQVSWTNFSPSTDNPYDPTTPEQGIFYGGQGADLYPVWVLECKGTDPANDLLSTSPSCYLTSAGRTDGPSGLGNSVYAVTSANGTAQVSLHVENAETNSQLGCDATHDCSIVVLPAFGGRQDPNATIDCADHSMDYPTEANGFQNDPTTLASDNMFGAACSWANRLVIPLHFAATPSSCPNSAPAFSAAGSPMLSRALQQWQAGWCQGSAALTFDYNSTSNEYQARSSFIGGGGALTSDTDVALTTQPAPASTSARPHTYAPLATTDIAVAFVIDDPLTGKVVPQVTLNARLMAKLLTQSYSLQFSCTSGGDVTKQSNSCDPAVKGNPDSIFDDPEFQSLNPAITPGDFSPQNLSVGEFLPTVVSGNSDLTWTLTSWIASDADARGFLAGKADRWGMHVNTYYKGQTYPLSQLAELDPGYVDPSAPAGNGTMQNAWQPVSGLDTVGRLLVGNSTSALSNIQTQCAAAPCPFPRVIDQLGARALFAVIDQGQASAYDFPVAKLVNAAGTAVAPTDESRTAALQNMVTNADHVTQRVDFAAAGAAAYPLTVVDYAMVPTCGITAATATGIRSLLIKVSQSQSSGVQPGDLAPGYQSLDAAQLAALDRATTAVSAHACPRKATTVKPTHPATASPTVAPTTPTVAPSGRSGVDATAINAPAGDPGPVSSPTGSTAPSTRTSTERGSSAAAGPTAGATSSPTLQPVAFGYKPPPGVSARYVLPILLVVGAVLLLAGPGLYFLIATGAGATAARLGRRALGRHR